MRKNTLSPPALPFNRVLFILCFLFMMLLPRVGSSAPEIIPEESLDFARSLFNKGEYKLSLLEYQRFIFTFPAHALLPEARMGEADCLFSIGDYGEALNRYLDMARDFSLSEKGWTAAFKAARCYHMTGRTPVSVEMFKRIASQTSWPALAEQARFELGWLELLQGNWREGSGELAALSSSRVYGEAARILAQKSPQGAGLPKKSPQTAGILSALVPGAGQIYCRQPKDAALSALLNGLFIGATVESFDHDLYILGGILSLVEMAWYGGNIYNAVNHAHQYNRRQKDNFVKMLWEESRIHLSMPHHEQEWYRLMLSVPF
jgi:tetratricopeptide (TPR) repeat protein